MHIKSGRKTTSKATLENRVYSFSRIVKNSSLNCNSFFYVLGMCEKFQIFSKKCEILKINFRNVPSISWEEQKKKTEKTVQWNQRKNVVML